MKDGFLKVGCATPEISVGNCELNTKRILKLIDDAYNAQLKLLVFPELCICGATCGDLFFHQTLISECEKSLFKILRHTLEKDLTICLGLPITVQQKLYNCVAVISSGNILAICPKKISNPKELRYFSNFNNKNIFIKLGTMSVPFGNDIIFKSNHMDTFTFAVEVGESAFSVNSLAEMYTLNGANIIINPSAVNDTGCSLINRINYIASQSKKSGSAYLFANAGYGESTTDFVFSGQNIIAENGKILKKSIPFTNSLIYSEIDLSLLETIHRTNTSSVSTHNSNISTVTFDLSLTETTLTRTIAQNPFIPDEIDTDMYFNNIFMLQAIGLSKRIQHTNAQKIIIGVSGGLDSTLALLVSAKTMDRLTRSRKDIIAVTMPCFGTSSRTHNNAELLSKALGVDFREINITDEATVHLKSIGHNLDTYDVTFENAQARIRTLILMDIANQTSGLVVGTGDLSELALGWATYNGDHMSMYGLNATIPKTLMQKMIQYEISLCTNQKLIDVLKDIVDTPISPELLPTEENSIQSTETIVGPYELHDFFIYYTVKYNFSPHKIFRLATVAFDGKYNKSDIKKWLNVFYKRFFSQQFKRSCLPDGSNVTGISLSPREGLFLPSDTSAHQWLKELEAIET